MYKVNKVDLKIFETISHKWFESLEEAKEHAKELGEQGYGAFVIKVEEIVISTVNI